MSKAEIIFLNNKAMDELGVADMNAVIHDVERVYTLTEQGDVISPGKCSMFCKRSYGEISVNRSNPDGRCGICGKTKR